ncbi:MAG: recombinase family protein, partial [Candidatus Micrarchaeaceae archaeon]
NADKLKDLGIGFVAVEEGIDTTTKNRMNEVLLGFLGTLAEFERQNIKERTHDQRLILWRRGQIPMGEIGYGYRWNKEKKQHEHHPDEAPVYKRLVKDFLMTPDSSLTKLAVQYEKEGLPTRNKRGRWFTGVLSKILSYESPHVTGKYITKEFIYSCEPLILPSQWKEVQTKLKNSQTRSGRPSKAKEVFLLHGLTSCAICGSEPLQCCYASARRSTGENPRRYTCWNHKATPSKLAGHARCSLPPIPADNLEEDVMQSFRRHLLNYDYDPHRWEEREQELQQEIAELQRERQGLDVSLANLDRLRKETNFDPAAWFKLYQEDTISAQRVEGTINEKIKELEEVHHKKSEQEFLIKYRTEAMDSLRRFAHDILHAPFQLRQRLIAGSLAGKITIKTLPGTRFEISVPWRLKLCLLREILDALLYDGDPDGGGNGAGANTGNRSNGEYCCSSVDRNRYGPRTRGKTRPHSRMMSTLIAHLSFNRQIQLCFQDISMAI